MELDLGLSRHSFGRIRDGNRDANGLERIVSNLRLCRKQKKSVIEKE